jgi:hypothetical protein
VSSGQADGHGAQHLVGDVQRFGLLSAAAVVDRYTEIIDRAARDDSFSLPPRPDDETTAGRMVDTAARIAEASLRLIDSTSSLIANIATPAAVPEMERLVLPATRSGFSCVTSLWVHNPTSIPEAGIHLHMTSLISSNGVSIPVASVSLSPERVDLVAAGSAREVELRVCVPADQPAGHYHGLVLSSSTPFEPIAVQLDVESPELARHDDRR